MSKIFFVSQSTKRMCSGGLETDLDVGMPPTSEDCFVDYYELTPQEERMFEQNHKQLYEFLIKHGKVLGYTIE